MPPPGRHPARSGRTAHGSAACGSAWQPRIARAGVVVLCPPGRWDSRPCPRTYPQIRARPKQGPLAPAAFTTFIATMGPSDSLSTRQDFTFRLYPPPSPNVGRRGGSPQFRIRLSLRALFPTPGVSCAPPGLPKRSLLPSPRNDGLGHSAFRLPISRGCKVHASALGPQVRSPRPESHDSGRAFDAPLRRRRLRRRPEPATRRSVAYRGGTSTRKSDAASQPDGPSPVSFRTHHAGRSLSRGASTPGPVFAKDSGPAGPCHPEGLRLAESRGIRRRRGTEASIPGSRLERSSSGGSLGSGRCPHSTGDSRRATRPFPARCNRVDRRPAGDEERRSVVWCVKERAGRPVAEIVLTARERAPRPSAPKSRLWVSLAGIQVRAGS